MIKDCDIICFSTSSWDGPWGSRQQLMWRFSERNRVLFVEGTLSFLHPLRYPFLWKRLGAFFKGVRHVGRKLYVWSPPPLFPFSSEFIWVNKINYKIILWFLRKILKQFDMAEPLLWIYPPGAVEVVGLLGEQEVVYHCIDNFPEEVKRFRRQYTLSTLERSLAQKSNLILASSQFLYDRHHKTNPHTYYFPSGVDARYFEEKGVQGTNGMLNKIRRPRIGIIGILDNRVDADLLQHLAKHLKGGSLVLVGSCRRKNLLKSILSFPNVHWLGEKESSEIPIYFSEMDVCLIPYKLNTFTRAISPLKLFEAFSLGKPIVARPLPELLPYKDLVYFADSPDEFLDGIEKSLTESDLSLLERRKQVARENSWERRMDRVNTLREKVLKEKTT